MCTNCQTNLSLSLSLNLSPPLACRSPNSQAIPPHMFLLFSHQQINSTFFKTFMFFYCAEASHLPSTLYYFIPAKTNCYREERGRERERECVRVWKQIAQLVDLLSCCLPALFFTSTIVFPRGEPRHLKSTNPPICSTLFAAVSA